MGKHRSKKKSNKKIRNAVSLEYNGMTFKSKLELYTYNKLKEAGIEEFKYEEDRFTIFEGFEYNAPAIEAYERTLDDHKLKLFGPVASQIRPITYLPDFTSINEDKTGWIIECKGFPNDAFPLKWKMFKNYLVRNGYNITLYKPSNQQDVLKTIELIKQRQNEKINKK